MTGAQYADDRNLAARQAIYTYQQPLVVLWEWALDHASLGGDEVVVDVGCGNGLYPAELARRGHRGAVVALDLSPGMLPAARGRAPGTGLVLGNAAALPLRDAAADVVLSMHMLYHVPCRDRAIAELRRVLQPGGTALVATNSETHLRELDALLGDSVAAVHGGDGGPIARGFQAFTLETAEPELRQEFRSVERHDAVSELVITDAAAIVSYAWSLRTFLAVDGEVDLAAVLCEVERRAGEVIDRHGAFRVRTSAGCFTCR